MNKRIISSVLVFLLFSLKLFSQEIITFKGNNSIIGNSVSILEDATNSLTIDEVQKSPKFIDSELQTPNLSLSNSNFWLRFKIKNQYKEDNLMLALEYPTLDVCEFYHPLGNKKYKVRSLSVKNPFFNRKYKHQNFLFDINLPKDSTAVFYLKVQSSEQVSLPLIIGTPQKIAEATLTKDLLWGALIGLILVMIFYNLFVYISTQDRSYLYYVLYTAFIGLTQISLSGYTYRYLFPNHPAIFHQVLIIFPALAGISAMQFVKSFLNTKERTPLLNKVFPIPIVFYISAIILRVSGYDNLSFRMIDISALSTTALLYLIAIKVSYQGYRPAKFFLLAWTIFFLGIILFTLKNLGVLPYNDFTNYTMQAGIALEVTLLSLALADKINILRKEKEKSQQETVLALQENERIVREQNIMLEKKVNKRTAELENSNFELNKTLSNLKQTQSQLVESEKMASLGQLTAGIAHEINNPINFVTSNVAPLKRDVEILLDTINTMEDINTLDISIADKQKKIEEYKEEIDYDYLKIEISHLLKGINEGASRTAEIVKGLRVFSRLDEDDLKLADINEGLESTLVIANNLLNGTKIIKDYANLPLVECYPGKLNQVFLNIISNAVHAVHKRYGEGSDSGEIVIKTEFDATHVFIKIADNGTGMNENTIRKIFEPFFTTKDVGEGTGLGMSIAYNTIKKHNGQIHLNSVEGKGTEFIIELPISSKISET